MSFCVREMLELEVLKGVKTLGKEMGLDNIIQGVTIIESPDIVKFINGGEVLLTGLYAFQSCSLKEFQGYVSEFSKKEISALIIKRGRDVENLEEKIEFLIDFLNKKNIPIFEIPFETTYKEVMGVIMERLFNQEVIHLKYFKSTHDNFAALSLSGNSEEDGAERILDLLSKLIGNPVALFNQNMKCIASTNPDVQELVVADKARKYEPDFYSNNTYMKQKAYISNQDAQSYNQYLVQLKVMYNVKIYLVITELHNTVSSMDFIAIENAVTALKYELFRRHSIAELEKKFENDIWNNILNGKVRSHHEIKKSAKLLGIDVDAMYRVMVFCLSDKKTGEVDDMDDRMTYFKLLNEAILGHFPNVKIQNDMDKIIIIQKVDASQKLEVFKRELKDIIIKVQKKISSRNKHLKVWAGVGKSVKGLVNIPDSFMEANDSLKFIDLLGEKVGDDKAKLMIFSEMGIFRLICQLEDRQTMMEYIPESLQKLYNYKKPQRDDLLVTLKTYLDRNQNLAKTAQDLYIHYKTAAYRIERIADITGIDFDNSNEILSVRIGLVVYNMIENMSK